jgi:uncharacterized protein YneF (UPF0154 family)
MKLRTGIILIILAGGIAYLAGSSLGGFLSKKKTADYLTSREQGTENILKEHVQFGVGDILPDYAFETLDFDTITFSECISDNSILVAVHPSCKTCIEEMSLISTIQSEHDTVGPFIFISSENPRIVQDLRDSLQLGNLFLYDHKGKFLSHFGIDVYPMVLKIDSNRQITEVILGSLLPEEIEEVLKGNKYFSE